MIDERKKMSKQPQPAPTASAASLALLLSKLVGRPGTIRLASSSAPPLSPPLPLPHQTT